MQSELPDIMDGGMTLPADPVRFVKPHFFAGNKQELVPITCIVAIQTPPFVLGMVGEDNFRMIS